MLMQLHANRQDDGHAYGRLDEMPLRHGHGDYAARAHIQGTARPVGDSTWTTRVRECFS